MNKKINVTGESSYIIKTIFDIFVFVGSDLFHVLLQVDSTVNTDSSSMSFWASILYLIVSEGFQVSGFKFKGSSFDIGASLLVQVCIKSDCLRGTGLNICSMEIFL